MSRARHFGPRDLIEGGSVRSRSTTFVNGQLTVPVARLTEIAIDVFNIRDARLSDIDYFYTSRLQGESDVGVSDVHSHPALPRNVRLGLQFGF